MEKIISWIIGLSFVFLISCEGVEPPVEPGNNPPAPDPPVGIITIHDTTHFQTSYFGTEDTLNIKSVVFYDTTAGIIHCELIYQEYHYRQNVIMYVPGPGVYPFQNGNGVKIHRQPNCGVNDSSPGGMAYSAVMSNDPANAVTISQFDSLGIAGSYTGNFVRYGMDSECHTYPMDTAFVWGEFYVTGF